MDLIDISQRPLNIEKGDYVIIASDGIHTLKDQELTSIVSTHGPNGPHAVSAAIIHAIENADAPHQDNATVIAVTTAV